MTAYSLAAADGPEQVPITSSTIHAWSLVTGHSVVSHTIHGDASEVQQLVYISS